MAGFHDLNHEILSFIITLLAVSANGATGLARLSATCHKFRNLSRNTEVLKVVNFQRISVSDYGVHRHMNDFLCVCARAGNQAAQSMLGKALLHLDAFFWRMILENDEPLLAQNVLASGLLRHQKLVRRFICEASDEDISMMRMPLYAYMISCLGYDVAFISGLLFTIGNMCSYYLEKRISPVDDVLVSPLRRVNVSLGWIKPPSGRAHRARVLNLYDQLIGGRE